MKFPLVVLDDILMAMKEKTSEGAWALSDIITQSKKYDELSNRDKKAVFAKLRKDGMADILGEPNVLDTLDKWYITFEGILLLKEGGYEGRQKRIAQKEVSEIAYNARMETYSLRLANWTVRLTWGTWAVSLGAIGLVAWEIYHSYYH